MFLTKPEMTRNDSSQFLLIFFFFFSLSRVEAIFNLLGQFSSFSLPWSMEMGIGARS